MGTQPTYEELRSAFNDYATCIGVFGAEIEARNKLISLRSKKTTWIGKEENDLRFAIDNAIEKSGE